MHINNRFSIETSEQVHTLCKPFLREFQLTSFNYARIYPDKSLTALHSHPLFAKLYLHLNCPPLPHIPARYWQYPSFYFLGKVCGNKHYQQLLRQSISQLNSDNPLYLVQQKKEYREVAVFSSALNDHGAINRYLNHLQDFSTFMHFFSEKTENLLEENKEHRLILPANLTPEIPTNVAVECPSHYEVFFNAIKLRSIFPSDLVEKLTGREVQCLYYLCRGYSYKAIAKQLTISFRTVESHITNIKTKLNIKVTSELVLYLSQNL